MSHRFVEGNIAHKRFAPKKHAFVYKFFMLDIDVEELETLSKPRLFSMDRFNLFAFYSKDHFGKSSLKPNIHTLCEEFGVDATGCQFRFVTLPRVLGFVFNPISTVVILKNNTPIHLLAEVHNYNGGRVVYSVALEHKDGRYYGNSSKDMYVSPFFKRDGEYRFMLEYTKEKFLLQVRLFEDGIKSLDALLTAKSQAFDDGTIKRLFWSHTLLTLWVVTRTLYQSLKLKQKGLAWNSVTSQDQKRRH